MQEHWNAPFEVIGCVEHGVFRVVPRGELDISTAPSLVRAMKQAERTNANIIVLDLRAVTFMDSTGVRCLLNAQERSLNSGERLLIRKGGPRIQELLERTGLDRDLPLI